MNEKLIEDWKNTIEKKERLLSEEKTLLEREKNFLNIFLKVAFISEYFDNNTIINLKINHIPHEKKNGITFLFGNVNNSREVLTSEDLIKQGIDMYLPLFINPHDFNEYHLIFNNNEEGKSKLLDGLIQNEEVKKEYNLFILEHFLEVTMNKNEYSNKKHKI